MKHLGLIAGLAALAIGTAAVAADAAALVQAREANFKVMGKAMKAAFDDLKSGNPQIATMRASATAIAGAAPKVAGLFPKGSGPEGGVKTHALPAIWARPADFKARADGLIAAATGFKAAADSGNLEASKAALMKLGGTCKACHQDFKAQD
jgi:cytochrome c556